MNLKLIFIAVISFFLVSCGGKEINESENIKKKRFEPNVKKRQEEAIQGISIFGDKKSNAGTISDNVIWQATLESLAFAPLNIASYSGGVISTDWYSFGDDEAKISVRIYSDKPSASAIKVTTFVKKCDQNLNCKIKDGGNELNKKIKGAILNKVTELEIKKATKE